MLIKKNEMKTLLTKFLAISSIALLMLASCKKDGALVTSDGGKAGALNSNTTTLALDKSKLNDTTKVINFTFTKPVYNFNAAVTNTLQIDSSGDNWKKPTSFTLGAGKLSQGFSTSDFNALLLKLNLHVGKASQVQVRVQHSVGASTIIYSNVLNLTVTPFNLQSWVYVPGAYEGWGNPGAAEDSLYSATSNGIYTGIINFTVGNNQFLIVPVKGSWSNKYATTDASSTGGTSSSYSTELVTGGGNNFYAPSIAGQYVVTLNVNTNTLTIVPANSYSVIGDGAQGWSAGNDVAMKYINDGNQNWIVTTPLVSTGSIKIRQNDDWAFSWGIPKPGSAGDGVTGTLNNSSNNNIPVPINGNYMVTFGIPITTTGTTPSVTATYTLTKQ